MIYNYIKDCLIFGLSKIDLIKLATEQKFHPTYVYDLKIIEDRFNTFKKYINTDKVKIHYALKANNHTEILKKMLSLGANVDVVSGGEISCAIESGFHPKQIIFSGIGKSILEIKQAISLEIKQINVESEEEFYRIAELAKSLNKKIDVAFRINPEVNPATHPYITTGFRENKFGIDTLTFFKIINNFSSFTHINLSGLTMHIGSQLQDLSAFEEALDKLLYIYTQLKSWNFKLTRIDIGGGIGVFYDSEDFKKDDELIKNYAEIIKKIPAHDFEEIIIEPGRSLVAKAGLLLTQVEYVKNNGFKNFLITNSGMNHLIRPALYQATHRIYPVQKFNNRKKILYDIVGPICESSDFLGKDRLLREIKSGEIIAIADTGAYGRTMASEYNMRALPHEVFF